MENTESYAEPVMETTKTIIRASSLPLSGYPVDTRVRDKGTGGDGGKCVAFKPSKRKKPRAL